MSGAPTLEKAFDRTPVARRVGRTRSPPTGSGSVGRVGTRGTDDHRRRRLRPLAGQGQGSLSDAEDLLHEARKAYGLSHLVYESGERIGVVRTVICTIQTERRDEYVERRRTLIDPVRKWSLKSRMPVEWAGVARRLPGLQPAFECLAEFGISRNGFTSPLFEEPGQGYAIISVTSAEPIERWDARKALLARDFMLIGQVLHASLARLEEARRSRVSLSGRQIECLRLIAEGANLLEASVRMAVAERTAKRYLEEARLRLNARTNAHAVSRAIALGLV